MEIAKKVGYWFALVGALILTATGVSYINDYLGKILSPIAGYSMYGFSVAGVIGIVSIWWIWKHRGA